MKPIGYLALARIVDAEGKSISFDRAIRYGWVTPGEVPPGFDLEPGTMPLGKNLFLDNGRQLLAYVWGGRSPMADYACQKFGVGTGTTPPTVIDIALESAVEFSAGVTTKIVDAVTFPSPFVARVEFTIGATQCNGYLLTEFGLFSGVDVLLARIVNAGFNKTSDFSPALSWSLRF